MGGREEVEVEMNKHWEENLRHLGLVGVVFLPGETQQSARDKHISRVSSSLYTFYCPSTVRMAVEYYVCIRIRTMTIDRTYLSKERRVSAGLESLRKNTTVYRKTGLYNICTT